MSEEIDDIATQMAAELDISFEQAKHALENSLQARERMLNPLKTLPEFLKAVYAEERKEKQRERQKKKKRRRSKLKRKKRRKSGNKN